MPTKRGCCGLVGVFVSGLGVTPEVLDWSRGETWMICAGSSCGCYGDKVMVYMGCYHVAS
jgi:hypothetical protein